MLFPRGRMKRLTNNIVGIPGSQIEDRSLELSKVRDVIELHAKDLPRIDALIQQLIGDLIQQGCLPAWRGPLSTVIGARPLNNPFNTGA